jgi:hypothetical protein
LGSDDRQLLHQIHPAKLATDLVSGLAGVMAVWDRQLIPGLLIAFVPPAVVSAIVMRYADLDRLADTALGRYVKRSMTRTMELLRLAGFTAMIVGAWEHVPAVIWGGLGAIGFAWLRGLITGRR